MALACLLAGVAASVPAPGGSLVTAQAARAKRSPSPSPIPTPTPTVTPTPSPSASPSASPSPSPSPSPSGSYTVVNNVIKDPLGRMWYAHGVDRPSLEWACGGQAVSGGGSGIPASDFTTMSGSWRANAVRVPMNQDFWLSATGATVASSENCPGYINSVKQLVANAEAAGLVVILDLHWNDEGNLLSSNVGQKCMPDQNSVTFWHSVASTFAADPHVMFELYNEPHDAPWQVWRNGGTFTCTDGVTYNAAGMQQLTNTVRATGATNVVVVGGLSWAFDLSGVAQVGLITGGNVAYATHPYEGSAGDSPAKWDGAFGFLTPSAPVIATEFGSTNCAVDAYDNDILTYFRTHGVAYTVWAWYVGGCNFPSVISNAAGTCVSYGCPTMTDITAYASGTQQVTTPSYAALPPPPAPSSNIHFDFEDGTTQGWAVDYGAGASAANSTAQAYSGTHSLAISDPANSYDGFAYKGALTGLQPGMTVTYRVDTPAGVNVTIEPYAADSAWNYHYLGRFTAATGQWTTMTWTIPGSWSGINDIGLQVDNSTGWSGTIWLDAVSWG